MVSGRARYARFAVPEGQRGNLTIETFGGTGDPDIYAKYGASPLTNSDRDKKSDKVGTVETITFPFARPGKVSLILEM